MDKVADIFSNLDSALNMDHVEVFLESCVSHCLDFFQLLQPNMVDKILRTVRCLPVHLTFALHYVRLQWLIKNKQAKQIQRQVRKKMLKSYASGLPY